MTPPNIRKKNRLPLRFYRGFRSNLVTLCTQGREKRFTSSSVVCPIVATLSIQSQKHCFAVHAYCIFENPLRSGLAKIVYDWPFSGSFVFEWRGFANPEVQLSRVRQLGGVVYIEEGGLKPPLQRQGARTDLQP